MPLERSPYVENIIHTSNLDGSVPILLIVNKDSDNPFGIYFTEILRAEGLNCFHTTDLATLQPASLEKYEVAILAETPLNAVQAEMFKTYVARGGRLVSMKNADGLEAVFGVERSEGSLSEGYIKTELSYPAGKGINPSTMQLHDVADLYDLAGTQPIAWLYSDRDTATEHPAIAINNFGEGLGVLFAFDLAKSIAVYETGKSKTH